MSHTNQSYRDFAKSRSQTNPCLTGLVEHLGRGAENTSTIVTLDYPQDGQLTPNPFLVTEVDLAELLAATSAIYGRVLLVENIRPSLVSLLGEILGLDPIFFAGHITTNFDDIEKAPPPPSLALFPSQIAERGYLHLHFQQVLDLGTSDALKYSTYALKTDSNIPRNVRRLPCLSGRQLALARACCSVVVKNIKGSWICLILVDPPAKTVIETLKPGGRKRYPSKPLHGGSEDFAQPTSFESFRSATGSHPWNKNSMLNSLLHYFSNQPPGFTVTQPSILSLGYYPMRIFLAEWVTYIHLLSRYFKYYEYSLHDIQHRLHDSDIVDLQRWRRRSMQSQQKLRFLAMFIDYWSQKETNKQPWDMVQKDISHVLSQLEHYSRSLEQMIPVATSMAQILDSQRAMLQTANVSRLTFIALVFVPLSWVASLFSMSGEYAPGHRQFWVYIATALPVLFVVLLLPALQWAKVAEKLKELGICLTRRAGKQKTGAEFA
ncbi:Zinc transport protein ZntB [Madurella mycetomatis]|uniref:Zinc transport protein ZntB n=1 Tax=Madurella mycetomatis TaxID=100816 RepID=A0A150ASB2_9PEZI|nr:Zinc transport protein ZntB [Madurella mycetomatis]